MKIINNISESFRNYIRVSFAFDVAMIATITHYATFEKGKEKMVTDKKIKRIKYFTRCKKILFFELPFLCKYFGVYEELDEKSKKEWK